MSEYVGKYAPIDFLGRKIEVGDLVVYPVRRGSSMYLRQSRVISTEQKPKDVYPASAKRKNFEYTIMAINDNGVRVALKHPGRMVCVPDFDTAD